MGNANSLRLSDGNTRLQDSQGSVATSDAPVDLKVAEWLLEIDNAMLEPLFMRDLETLASDKRPTVRAAAVQLRDDIDLLFRENRLCQRLLRPSWSQQHGTNTQELVYGSRTSTGESTPWA